MRAATLADIDALIALENTVFATDRLSRRSLRRFLQLPTAQVLVAEEITAAPKDSGGCLAGTAILLFRRGSPLARLYSIAVVPELGGRGIATMLLAAAEAIAAARGCAAVTLEVRETNATAISRYRKSGYGEFGRHAAYYQDGVDALRFRKSLAAPAAERSCR